MTAIRFGIRLRLWLALAVVAGLTVVASAVAWIANSASGEVLGRMAERHVPAVVALADLAQNANHLIAAAPAVLFVTSPEDLQAEWWRLEAAEDGLRRSLEAARAQVDDSPALDEVARTAGRVGVQVQILLSAMDHSLTLKARQRALDGQVEVLQQEYRALSGLSPAGSPASAEAVALLGEVSRLLVLLGEVGRASDDAALDTLGSRLDLGLRHLTAALPGLEGRPLHAHLARFTISLDLLARADGNLIALRRADLRARAVAAQRLQVVRQQAGDLERQVGRMVGEAQAGIRAEHTQAGAMLGQSKVVLAVTSGLGILAAVVVAWRYVGVSVIGRLHQLAGSMRAIAGGDLQAPIPTGGADEVSDMGRALVVFRDALTHVRHLATHDTLTGLANRRLFEERLTTALREAPGEGTVVYVNLRTFKDVNDTFGHSVGDRLLLAVADRLRWMARGQDMAARLGGDDFVLLIPGLIEPAEQEVVLGSLDKVLSAPVSMDVIEIEVQPVIGVVTYPADGVSAPELLANAEMAMNAARTAVLAPIAHYRPEMGAALAHRKAIRADLKSAIQSGEMQLLYQPKIDLRSGRVAGVEALVRWNHPQHGRINPADFIPVAERSGLIVPLGAWVLREGCRQARQWQDAGLGALRVALNVSPVQVLRHDVVAVVREALAETGLSPDLLEVEITEGVLMQEEGRAMQRLRSLRDLGVRLAIDDFGTGYSSLSYLKRLPVTCLKIDQSFVRGLTVNEEDMRLSRVIIGMAHDFGLEAVAEGIESREHMEFLREEGCDIGQGYFYSRPVEADTFARMVQGPLPWLEHSIALGRLAGSLA